MIYAFKDDCLDQWVIWINVYGFQKCYCVWLPDVFRSDSDVQIVFVLRQPLFQLLAVISGKRWQYIGGHQENTMKSHIYISCKYRSPSRSATETEKTPLTARIIDLCLYNPFQEPIWNVISPFLFFAMVCKLWRIHYFTALEGPDRGLLASSAMQVQHCPGRCGRSLHRDILVDQMFTKVEVLYSVSIARKRLIKICSRWWLCWQHCWRCH